MQTRISTIWACPSQPCARRSTGLWPCPGEGGQNIRVKEKGLEALRFIKEHHKIAGYLRIFATRGSLDGRPIHDMETGNKHLRARMKNKFPLLKWQRLDQEHCKIFVPSLVRPTEVHTYYVQWARTIRNADSVLELQHLMTTL